MNSTVTVKYQTTIPKAVRDRLGIRINDAIEWRVSREGRRWCPYAPLFCAIGTRFALERRRAGGSRAARTARARKHR